MERFSKIELQGVTGKFCKVLTHAGDAYGFTFPVLVDDRTFEVKVIPTGTNKLSGFVFQKDRPIHVKGCLSLEYSSEKGLGGEVLERVDVVVEATEVEYLEPENKKED